jgi:hypothetical protein
MAAHRALEFAQAAIINRDMDAAYDLFSEEIKPSLTKEKFSETVSRMHPSATPTTIRAVSYDFFLSNPKAVTITLIGDNPHGDIFYYRISLTGTKASGYNVVGMSRDQGRANLSNLGRNFKPSTLLVIQSTASVNISVSSSPISSK